MPRPLAPDAFVVEVGQLLGARLADKIITEDLLRHVVHELARVPLFRATQVVGLKVLVVDGVQTYLATFHHTPDVQLVADALQDGFDQAWRVPRGISRDFSKAKDMLTSTRPRALAVVSVASFVQCLEDTRAVAEEARWLLHRLPLEFS